MIDRAHAFVAVVTLTASLSGAGEPAFSDDSQDAGLLALHADPGDPFAGGGCVGDFNGDGHTDVFFCGGANPDILFLNNGNGTFATSPTSGVQTVIGSTGAACADYDADGDLDLLVTVLNEEPGRDRLYQNNGDAQFTDVAAAAGVASNTLTRTDGWGGAWGDFDLDGDLDLAVAGATNGGTNRLFRNDGDGTFTDVVESAGLGPTLNFTCGFAPRFADLNHDRYPELLWIGCLSNSNYFINDTDGTFTDFTVGSGTNHASSEMGIAVADFNNDQRFDYYVTTIYNNKLYLNRGDHTYDEVATNAGVVNTGWGWACDAIDFDHDGRPDIVATSQDIGQFAFRNSKTDDGPLLFDDVSAASGFVSPVSGRGLATFDADNDGDRDVVIFPHNHPIRLLRNDLVHGADTGWIRVILDRAGDNTVPPHGIGAEITVTVGRQSQLGTISGGSNYLSQSELGAHFGLGTATLIDEIRVRWPSGAVTTRANVGVNQTLIIGAGCGADLNDDGEADIVDLLLFLDDWFAGPREILELLTYLRGWFEGCA